jgi:Icc-related predicted phosphoesterase
MKLVIISDTHNKHKYVDLPSGDILIHAGDLTSVGYKSEVERLFEWFHNLISIGKYKEIIFIAGNHDKSFDPKFNPEPELEDQQKGKPGWLNNLLRNLPSNIHYLENSDVTIDGIKFWGSPWTPWFYGQNWGFNAHRGDEIREYWKQIPMDTNVIITHGPVAYKLDYVPYTKEYKGCEDLRYYIEMIKPLLHISGHIHESYGMEGNGDTVFINASIMNSYFEPLNKPWVVEITTDREIKVEDNG